MATAKSPWLAGDGRAPLWAAPLRFLEREHTSVWRYALWAWPVAMVPSLLLAAAALVLLPALGAWSPSPSSTPPTMSLGRFASSTILAPLIETLVLSAMLEALGFSQRGLLRAAAVKAGIVAAIFALLHGWVALPWFFSTVWSFFVFSCAYLRWRQRSWDAAFLCAVVPHVLLNLTVGLVLLAREAL